MLGVSSGSARRQSSCGFRHSQAQPAPLCSGQPGSRRLATGSESGRALVCDRHLASQCRSHRSRSSPSWRPAATSTFLRLWCSPPGYLAPGQPVPQSAEEASRWGERRRGGWRGGCGCWRRSRYDHGHECCLGRCITTPGAGLHHRWLRPGDGPRATGLAAVGACRGRR